MSHGPTQPDEPVFPETQDALGLLASAALPAEARARHLHAIRMRAADLGDAPVTAGADRREAPALPQRARAASERGLTGLRWRGRRAAAVAGVWLGSLSLGTGVAAAAAMDDLPGDGLYGLKRAIENVQLRLPGDMQDDVQRRLELAARRLAEAESLRAGGADAALLVGVLGDAETLIDEAGRLAAGDSALTATVAESASRARLRLTQLLEGGLPEQAADRAREAIEAATERAEEREDDDDRGRGRGGDEDDDDERPRGSAASDGRSDERDQDDDGQGRGRGRGGDDDADTDDDADDVDDDDSGGPPPSEADEDDGDDDEPDEDGSPSGRGQSSDDDDDDDSGSGSGQGQSATQGQSSGQSSGQGQGQGQGNADKDKSEKGNSGKSDSGDDD